MQAQRRKHTHTHIHPFISSLNCFCFLCSPQNSNLSTQDHENIIVVSVKFCVSCFDRQAEEKCCFSYCSCYPCVFVRFGLSLSVAIVAVCGHSRKVAERGCDVCVTHLWIVFYKTRARVRSMLLAAR